ncbi:MAG: ATP-binding protein [Gammaproteobacteria bacterium]|nr:ATP-binding protein [Gammaproteobacteria bacterium]MDH5618153.1 ATP-binding protein [Gammaproteobacteria bacterium]
MNLRRQLLLVSLLTLMLPWAGCEFIRETEIALRDGQRQMLADTARAIAGSMVQHSEEFPVRDKSYGTGDQLYVHRLESRPKIDGYFDDWTLPADSLRSIRGADGPIRFAVASYAQATYLYVEVMDRSVVYATPQSLLVDGASRFADRVTLASSSPPYLREAISFAAEAPGRIISYRQSAYGFEPEPTISAFWQDIPGGYRVEARIPSGLLGTHLGLSVQNTPNAQQAGTRSSSFTGRTPGRAMSNIEELDRIAALYVQSDTRLILTDFRGWRIGAAGELAPGGGAQSGGGLARRVYDLLVEQGREAAFAEPDPLGREQQPYVSAALEGRETGTWFRNASTGTAIVAVAAPVTVGDEVVGAVVLQRGTQAILSQRNEGLSRLINVTLLTTLVVAGALLGYATWLSRRIRALSIAAEDALETENLSSALPSALADDEIGDLSRSFSWVLQQLGEYNAYLRSLASKLSHELRTPLAIVTSSLENLEHEPLNEASHGYTARAREGADRLRRILSAMSEASRVEELMAHAEPEPFDMRAVLESTTAAYRDVYRNRLFGLVCKVDSAQSTGSPELLIQMLDKLVDNAVDFSEEGDTITLSLEEKDQELLVSVTNPGPELPERMRSQMFDSMVSVRSGEESRHLGLGLYVARLIAEGHGGRIAAENVDGGVRFTVAIPRHQGPLSRSDSVRNL